MDSTYFDNLAEKIKLNYPKLDDFTMAFKGCKAKIFHEKVTEGLILDEHWIIVLENALFSIEQIAKDPKKFIADENNLVKIEKAKKINSNSIKYLSSHTHHIASIEDDRIIPSKIMTTETIEEVAIYENKFIITLIKHLVAFVEKRYQNLKDVVKTYDVRNMFLEASFKVNSTIVDYVLTMAIKNPSSNRQKMAENFSLLRRIEVIRKRLLVLKTSDFYKALEHTKPLFAPIMKTNIIVKNINYNNAYRLWLFIFSYKVDGFTLEIAKKQLPVDELLFDDMAVVSALNVCSLASNDNLRLLDYERIPFKTYKSKRYKVLNNFNFDTKIKFTNEVAEEAVVNDFYLNEIKKAIGNTISSIKGNTYIDEKNIDMSFTKFFKSLTKINNNIFFDILKIEKKKSKIKKSTFDKKKELYDYQKEVCRNNALLIKLKTKEIESLLKGEAKELVKLDKVQFEFDLEKDKKDAKKAKVSKKKTKTKSNERLEKAMQNAEEYKDELADKETDREQAYLEERKRKFEQMKINRELKLLEKLKQKYENN